MCPRRKDEDNIRDFFMAQLNQLFYFTSYSPAKAFFGKILNVVSTFLWSFTDLFVIVVSLGLSTRFKQINDSLMRHKGMVCARGNCFPVFEPCFLNLMSCFESVDA